MRKKRRPLLAVLLSLLLPGLGQLYNGQLAKAVVCFAIDVAFWLALGPSPLMTTFAGLVATVSVGVAFAIAVIADAAVVARRRGEIELRAFNRVWVYVLAYVGSFLLSTSAGLFAGATLGGFESYGMPSGSMEPTVEIGDVIWTGSLALTGAAARRGDVVVFMYPDDPTKDFIKRIVGVAGDVVEMREGLLVVNGRPVERCHLGELRYTELDALTGAVSEARGQLYLEHLDGRTYRVLETFEGETVPPTTVRAGEVYVLGDNRGNSHDSRRFGGVPVRNIRGRALFGLYARPAGGGWSLARAGAPLDDLAEVSGDQRELLRRCRAEGFTSASTSTGTR